MSTMLAVAATLAILIGAAHTVLGEKYLIRRLLRRDDLPHLFGDQTFTRRTIRFAWHLTSIAWVGLGAVLLVAANHTAPAVTPLTSGTDTVSAVTMTIGVTFVVSAVVTAVGSRFRHLAWVVFLAIGVLALMA
jgi:hypothetical protein